MLKNQRWSPRGRPWPRGRPRGHILKSLASKPQVLGLGLGLEASSPWPWPRSLKSSKIALSSARGQHYFWTVEILFKTPETSLKICKYLFYFAQLERRLSQAGLPPIEISSMIKMWQKSLLFLQFQFLFRVFVYTSSEQQYWRPRAPGPPKINFCQPI